MNKKFFLLLVIFALFFSSCGFPVRYTTVRGSGNIIFESRRVADFNSVDLSGIGMLIIEQGDKESLEISAEENLLPYLRSEVSGNNLKLGVQEFVNIQPTEDIIYRLTVKDLNTIETSGLGNVEIDSLETNRLFIEISGSGKVSIDDLRVESVTLEISGLGDINLTGKVSDQRVKLSGAGSYQAGNLESSSASVEISGTGNAVVWAIDTLTIELSGAGKVEYYGSPVLNSDISGVGQLKSLGEK